MTHSMSMVAPACPALPPATASSPPWASSRSPGTTASTQVGVRGWCLRGVWVTPPAHGDWSHLCHLWLVGAGLNLKKWVLHHPGAPVVLGLLFHMVDDLFSFGFFFLFLLSFILLLFPFPCWGLKQEFTRCTQRGLCHSRRLGCPCSPGLRPAVISGCWTPPASWKNPLIALGPKNTPTSGWRMARLSRCLPPRGARITWGKPQADLNLAPSARSSVLPPPSHRVSPTVGGGGWEGCCVPGNAGGGIGGKMPRLGQRMCLGSGGGKMLGGPHGTQVLNTTFCPLQKCLTASPHTCGEVSSPAAMMVSVPLLLASVACPIPPLRQAELLGILQSTHENPVVPASACMRAAQAPPLKVGLVLCCH